MPDSSEQPKSFGGGAAPRPTNAGGPIDAIGTTHAWVGGCVLVCMSCASIDALDRGDCKATPAQQCGLDSRATSRAESEIAMTTTGAPQMAAAAVGDDAARRAKRRTCGGAHAAWCLRFVVDCEIRVGSVDHSIIGLVHYSSSGLAR